MPLAQRSHQLWREIESETGTDVLTTNGVLVMASPGVHARHHGKTRFLETTLEAAAQRTRSTMRCSARRASPAASPSSGSAGDERGYFEPGGGFVRPEAAVARPARTWRAAAARAAHRRDRDAATCQERHGVTVTTTRARLHADRLVLAAGAWARLDPRRTLRERCSPISRQVAALVRRRRRGRVASCRSDCPPSSGTAGADSFYGVPAIDGAPRGVKVGVENARSVRSPDAVERTVERGGDRDVSMTLVSKRIPGLVRRPFRVATCLYTTTPDGDFVVDRHPEHPSVLVVSACSGHGFKHSAAIGEAVAAGIAGETPAVDLSPFTLGVAPVEPRRRGIGEPASRMLVVPRSTGDVMEASPSQAGPPDGPADPVEAAQEPFRGGCSRSPAATAAGRARASPRAVCGCSASSATGAARQPWASSTPPSGATSSSSSSGRAGVSPRA